MSGNRIMVGNLPYEADERAISDALGHLGHITDCKVRIDRWPSKIPT
jgi:RNA recognition motif-containing protein